MNTKLGKPEVKPILIKVLYGATSGIAGTVAMRDAVKVSTFDALGIDPTSLGQVANGQKAGTQKSDKLFNACFSELKKDGLVESPLRNRYTLTDAGVRHCHGQGHAVSTVAPAAVAAPVVPVVAPEAPVEAPVVAPEAPVVAVATPEPTTQQNAAHKAWKTRRQNDFLIEDPEPTQDAYLLSLMIASSGCFGVSPSSRSKTCKGCPAFAACTQARAARLGELAMALEAQAKAHQIIDIAALTAPPADEPEPAVVLPEDAVVVPVEVEGVECEHCGTHFQVGTNGVILRGLGMFHEQCVADALTNQSDTAQAVGSA